MLGGLSRRFGASVTRAGPACSSLPIPTRAFAISTKRKFLNKLNREVYATRPEDIKVELGMHEPHPNSVEDPCYVLNPPGGLRAYCLNRNKEGNPLRADVVEWLQTRLVIANERQGTGDLYGVVIRNAIDGDATSNTFSTGVDLAGLHAMDTEGRVATFKAIYQLAGQISKMTKPVVVMMDGITGDTSAGLCLNSKLRAASEFTQFSIDQCGWGYFPDGGATHWLPKLDGGLGMYLALTGDTLYGRDLVFTKIANYYIPTEAWVSFMDVIQENIGHPDSVELGLQDMCQMWGGSANYPCTLEQHQGAIDRCFQKGSVEAVMEALAKEGTGWAKMTLSRMGTKCPLSLKVTHKALTKARTQTIEECLRMEFRLCRQFMQQRDFLEGMDAFVNKRDPIWLHSGLDEVEDRQVDMMFTSIEGAPELNLPYLDFDPTYDPRKDRKPTHAEWVDDSDNLNQARRRPF